MKILLHYNGQDYSAYVSESNNPVSIDGILWIGQDSTWVKLIHGPISNADYYIMYNDTIDIKALRLSIFMKELEFIVEEVKADEA